MKPFTIINGKVLTPSGISDTSVCISDGKISAHGGKQGEIIDAAGKYVLPGIVDLHGDGFERILMPRPRVAFPIDVALRETDHQLIANGITTAFHSLTVSWEPGLRSLDRAKILCEAVGRSQVNYASDMYIHIRWETFALDQAEAAVDLISENRSTLFAFNDHTTKLAEERWPPHKKAQMQERTGITPEAYQDLMQSSWSRRNEVPEFIASVAGKAAKRGAVLLAHDEETPTQRETYRSHGVHASEFPLSYETARNARQHNEHTILGAPNIVRGGSHNGALDATKAVSEQLCTILASDYYYPSQLLAASKLVHLGVSDAVAAWSLISRNPAELARLEDRGSLEAGKRADILIVDGFGTDAPTINTVIVAGRPVYRFSPT